MEQETKVFLNKIYVLAIILIAGLVVFFFGELNYQRGDLDLRNQNQITVSGEGKVYAKPDVALVSLGVTSESSTVAAVTKDGTIKMNAVVDAAKKLGVQEKDIQTTNYSLSPVYETTSSPVSAYYPMPIKTSSRITGYRLDQNIQVKIRDFTKIGDIISGATGAGSNVVGDLQFTIDDMQKFKDQARSSAIKQAKTNAQNLAKESGIQLDKLINVYEGYTPVYYSKNVAMGMGGAAPDAASIPTIQPGQQEIDVTINLTYRVK